MRRRVKRGHDQRCGLSQRNACLMVSVPSFLLYSNSHIFVSKTVNCLNLCFEILLEINDLALINLQRFSLHSCFRFESRLIVKYRVVTIVKPREYVNKFA